MQFRQNGPRDERRRRVLRDESLISPSATDGTSHEEAAAEEAKTPSRGYSAAVAVESQPPISCLIATRPWTLTVVVLAGLTMIAGLEAVYATIFHGSALPSEMIAALDVTARGSLAAWYSSLLLSLAAVNAVLVYWLRSHKLDDYRGRYRVWLWTALGLTLAAVDASTGLHEVVGHLLALQFEATWLQSPLVNGVVVLSLVFGSLAIRLGFEIWPSRLARAFASLAVTGYVTAILLQLNVLAIDGGMLAAMASSTAILVANLAAAFTIASYCRYVHLESQGALKPRRQRRAKQVAAEQPAEEVKQARAAAPAPASRGTAKKRPLRSENIQDKSIRCDAAHQTGSEAGAAKTAPARSEAANQATNKVAANAADNDELDPLDFDPETGQRLSKSERRRLRKQMRRQKKAGSGG